MRVLTCVLAICLTAGLLTPAESQDRQGYALRTSGRLIFIDVGEEDQVQPGDLFQVVRHETIIHPATGEDLSQPLPLGIVRVVEVFPKFATSEVVDLEPDVDMEMLDTESKQGIIRIQVLPKELIELIGPRLQEMATGEPAPRPPTYNPDGKVRGFSADLTVDFGSRGISSLPDSIYSLIPAALLDRAASSVNQPLSGVNASKDFRVSLTMPLARRLSMLAQGQFGSASVYAAGLRLYPGALLGSGARVNPDGKVGEPVLMVLAGQGGAGGSTLPQAVLDSIVSRSDETYIVDTLGLTFPTPAEEEAALADSISRVTNELRTAAGDSLASIVKGGLGLSAQLTLPISPRWTTRLGYRHFGNINEISGGLTFYSKTIVPDIPTNPDGVVGAFAIALDGTYITSGGTILVGLDLKYPIAPTYTLGLSALTDLGGYTRIGLRLKGYIDVL